MKENRNPYNPKHAVGYYPNLKSVPQPGSIVPGGFLVIVDEDNERGTVVGKVFDQAPSPYNSRKKEDVLNKPNDHKNLGSIISELDLEKIPLNKKEFFNRVSSKGHIKIKRFFGTKKDDKFLLTPLLEEIENTKIPRKQSFYSEQP